MVLDLKDYKCYKFQRNKWLDPKSCNLGTLKVVKMVYPNWEKYEQEYIKELEGYEKNTNC
jgi:hypothetical protein